MLKEEPICVLDIATTLVSTQLISFFAFKVKNISISFSLKCVKERKEMQDLRNK